MASHTITNFNYLIHSILRRQACNSPEFYYVYIYSQSVNKFFVVYRYIVELSTILTTGQSSAWWFPAGYCGFCKSHLITIQLNTHGHLTGHRKKHQEKQTEGPCTCMDFSWLSATLNCVGHKHMTHNYSYTQLYVQFTKNHIAS